VKVNDELDDPAALRMVWRLKRKDKFYPNWESNPIFCNVCPVLVIILSYMVIVPIPVVAPSKASVYGRSLDGISGSNPAGGMDVCLL
jgi:hypothetical protein